MSRIAGRIRRDRSIVVRLAGNRYPDAGGRRGSVDAPFTIDPKREELRTCFTR
jgi:hypothetical protein